jgi:hypothetical protein
MEHDWIFGPPPHTTSPHQLLYALGRYGDIYGPISFEMIAPEAWSGNMAAASLDLRAFAFCTGEWRDHIAIDERHAP